MLLEVLVTNVEFLFWNARNKLINETGVDGRKNKS